MYLAACAQACSGTALIPLATKRLLWGTLMTHQGMCPDMCPTSLLIREGHWLENRMKPCAPEGDRQCFYYSAITVQDDKDPACPDQGAQG